MEWRKLSKNIVFTQNHEIGNFHYFLVFWKMKQKSCKNENKKKMHRDRNLKVWENKVVSD